MYTVLVGGAYFDPTSDELVDNGGIVIDGNRIVQIGGYTPSSTDTVIDVQDRVVLPGLVNLHEHLMFRATIGPPYDLIREDPTVLVMRSVRNAHLSIARGITTVRELASAHGIGYAFKRAIASGLLVGPRMFVAGMPLAITGGHAWVVSREVDGVDAVRGAVRELAKQGSDWVKVMASSDPEESAANFTRPDYSQEELDAIVDEAHRRGLRVTTHVMGEEAIRRCLAAGTDTIEHGVYLTDDLAAEARSRGIRMVPTISSYRRTVWPDYQRGDEWSRLHEPLIAPHTASVKRAIAAGVSVGVGTDSIGNYIEELQILIELGLPPYEALRAATLGGAEVLGQEHRFGSIEAGKVADMVVVDGNPLDEIEALNRVVYTVADGRIHTPADFKAVLTSTELLVDQF